MLLLQAFTKAWLVKSSSAWVQIKAQQTARSICTIGGTLPFLPTRNPILTPFTTPILFHPVSASDADQLLPCGFTSAPRPSRRTLHTILNLA